MTMYCALGLTVGVCTIQKFMLMLMLTQLRRGGKLCMLLEARNIMILCAKNYKDWFKMLSVIEEKLADIF